MDNIIEKNYQVRSSIHTIEIETKHIELDGVPPQVHACINAAWQTKSGNWRIIINPNKYQSDIFRFEEFKDVFAEILNAIKVDLYNIRRVDLRMDSYEDGDYQSRAKLYRLIISLLAMKYKVKNGYKTLDLFTQRQKSIAIKNADFEAEHYDRNEKSRITGNITEKAKSRFEIRSIHHNDARIWTVDIIPELFLVKWFVRLDKATSNENFAEVESQYNDALRKLYEDKECRIGINEFLRTYSDCIFTTRQGVELLDSIGAKNSRKVISNYKSRSGCEFFLKNELKNVIEKIKDSMMEYFEIAHE